MKYIFMFKISIREINDVFFICYSPTHLSDPYKINFWGYPEGESNLFFTSIEQITYYRNIYTHSIMRGKPKANFLWIYFRIFIAIILFEKFVWNRKEFYYRKYIFCRNSFYIYARMNDDFNGTQQLTIGLVAKQFNKNGKV